jgi:subtilisin family serine protease
MKRIITFSIHGIVLFFFAATFSLSATSGAKPFLTGDGIELADHYLVTYSGDEADFRMRMRTLGVTVVRVWDALRIASVHGVQDNMLAALHADESIDSFARDVTLHWVHGATPMQNVHVQAGLDATSVAIPENAEFYGIQWGLRQIHAAEAWSVSRGSAAVRVGVLDTGISPDHVDLAGKYDLDASINLSASNTADRSDYIDRHYHGTHISALIASNNRGVAGVAPDVTLVGVKVLDDEGNASFCNLIAGIMYAVEEADVDIINLSVGGTGTMEGTDILSGMLHAAIDYAERNGVVVVAAAGNEGVDLGGGTLHNYVVTDESGTILVSATAPVDENGAERIACYSNFGDGIVGLSAPGGGIDCAQGSYTAMTDMVISALAPAVARRLGLQNPEAWYMFASGTSMAAPMVTGVAALVKSANPGMDPAGICEKLRASADDLGNAGPDGRYGNGRVNASGALR